MDNFVEVSDGVYVNLAEAVKVEAKGDAFVVSIREGDGSLADYHCSPGDPGYSKLKKLLNKARK